jgi:hypothetical protein
MLVELNISDKYLSKRGKKEKNIFLLLPYQMGSENRSLTLSLATIVSIESRKLKIDSPKNEHFV